MKKDYINTGDYTKEELLDLAQLGILIKKNLKAGFPLNLLYHKTLLMIFEQSSTITRMAFESAMNNLGGTAQHLKFSEVQFLKDESFHDISKVVSHFSDIMLMCVHNYDVVEKFAKNADIPVINGMSDYNYPTKELGDLITILENLPDGKKIEDIKVSFVGSATKACTSLMMLCTKIGAHFVQVAPLEYQLNDDLKKIAEENCKSSNGSFVVTDDEGVVSDSDFIYTDMWNKEGNFPDNAQKYQITMEMMNKAGGSCKFMHCLPAARGQEVTDEVIDSERSLAFDGVENYLAAARAILTSLMGKSTEAQEICKRNIGE